jgi:Anti-sigma-D factor RsdA to sigma factor binding region
VRQPRNGENRSGGKHPRGHDHPHPNGTNGVRPAGMRTHRVSLHERELDEAEEPVDLVALQADDELIDALASGLSVSSAGSALDVDDKVSAILAAWRADVDAEPIPELVDLDTAVATVQAARRPSRRARHLVPVAAAAAALVTLLGGVSLGSYSAEPDDVLWPVAKVLYSERTGSVEAAGRVEERIARAKQAIAAGQPVVAEQELQAAAADLAAVRPEEGRTALVEVQGFLQAKAEETPPGVPTDPGAPLAADQARKVPPGAEITSPARTSEQASTADRPAEEPGGSSGPSRSDRERPAAPVPADPRILREEPAPEPAESVAPTEDSAPSAEAPGNDEPVEPPPPEEDQVPEPAAPGVDGGAAAPQPAPDGAESIGATASDSSTTAPSPTS